MTRRLRLRPRKNLTSCPGSVDHDSYAESLHLKMHLNFVAAGGIQAVVAETKKDAEASFFKDLQTSLELCRSIIGAGNETRTRDLNLGKVALYQLSYSRKIRRVCYRNREQHTSLFTPYFTSAATASHGMPACHRGEKQGPKGALSKYGAGNETRTRDLNLGKVALYQLSYSRRLSTAPTASHPGVLEASGPSTCVEGALLCRDSFTPSTCLFSRCGTAAFTIDRPHTRMPRRWK